MKNILLATVMMLGLSGCSLDMPKTLEEKAVKESVIDLRYAIKDGYTKADAFEQDVHREPLKKTENSDGSSARFYQFLHPHPEKTVHVMKTGLFEYPILATNVLVLVNDKGTITSHKITGELYTVTMMLRVGTVSEDKTRDLSEDEIVYEIKR